MDAKKNSVVATRKGKGRVKDQRAASSGGRSDSTKVARLTNANDQRAKTSAINAAIKSAAQITRILVLVPRIRCTHAPSHWS